jgi:hypothetical protein
MFLRRERSGYKFLAERLKDFGAAGSGTIVDLATDFLTITGILAST